MDTEPGRIKDIRAYRSSFIGIGLLACAAFLIFGAWSSYGAAGALSLFAVWLVLCALGCRWFSSHPGRVLVLGVASMAGWLLAVIVAVIVAR